MPRATFYYNLSKKADKWSEVRKRIVKIFHLHHGRYGYRRITQELHNEGHNVNHKTVRKLMKEAGIVCTVRMKKYRSYKGEVGKVAPNLLSRAFKTDMPLTKLVTDVTEFSLFGQKLYLSPVLDLYNGEILCYTLYDRPVLTMVTEMIEKLVKRTGKCEGTMLHSDQGWQYQHKLYQKMLRDSGFEQSMSRKGNCLDNSVMENFFGLLKSELLYLQEFQSIEHFKKSLHAYIKYYNNDRIKSRLGGLSPVEYRMKHEHTYAQ